MISEEDTDDSDEFEVEGDKEMLLEDPLRLTRKCACCSNTMKDGDQDLVTPSKTRNRKPIHSMISDSFSVPNGALAEADFLCCLSCSTVITNMTRGVQALKNRMADKSIIHSFFQTFQVHMTNFSNSRSRLSLPETPEQSTLSPIVLDVSSKSAPKTYRMKPSKKQPNRSSETLLPTDNITPCVSVAALPMKNRVNTQITFSTDNSHSTIPSSLTRTIGTGILMDHRDVDMGEMAYPDAVLTEEEKLAYRKTQNITRVIDCPAPYCGQVFTGQLLAEADGLLDRHMTMFHPTFVCCHFCDTKVYGLRETMARQLLQRHLKDQHEGEPVVPENEEAQAFPLGTKIFTYNCKFCPRKVHGSKEEDRNRTILNTMIYKHRVKEHGVSLQCKYCKHVTKGTPGNIQQKMNRHVKFIHENQSDFLCRICQKPFTENNYIRKHEFTHFSQEEKEAELEKDPSIQTTTLCPTCGVVLKGILTTEQVLLSCHMKQVHPKPGEKRQGEHRRLMCDQCDYTSSHPRLLARHKLWRHVQVDSPYFKYTCKQCGVGFLPGQGKEFKDHTMVCCDESERPVICTEPGCARRFTTKQNLMGHLIGFHKQTPEAARAFLYPGLPVRDWIHKIKRVPKRKKMAEGSQEDYSEEWLKRSRSFQESR